MNIYDEISDLYNFDKIEEYKPQLKAYQATINNETIQGYTFTTPKGLNVFTYRTDGTMGNHWYLYNLNTNKHVINGRRTRKQIIEDAGLI